MVVQKDTLRFTIASVMILFLLSSTSMVAFAQTALSITAITDTPDPFSPNGDGINDTSTLRFTSNLPGTYSVVIRNSQGVLINTLTGSMIAAVNNVVWNGQTSTGTIPSNGPYRYYLTATSTDGQTRNPATNGDALTRLDTVPPTTSNMAITPATFPMFTVTATATDILSNINAAEMFIDATGQNGQGTAMSASDGTFNARTEGVTGNIDGSPLSPGPHTVYVHSRDLAGNWGNYVSMQFEATPGTSCTVDITPSGSPLVRNVGERNFFSAVVSGITPTSYQWSITGDLIKDYDERSNWAAWPTTGTFTTLQVTQMTFDDLNDASISFYWLPDQSQIYPSNAVVTRNVSVSINNGLCTDSQSVSLERNTSDQNRQPEDFYVTLNHPVIDSQAPTVLLQEHNNWHLNNPRNSLTYEGRQFLAYHRAMVDNYNAWRALFGYPVVGSWAPSGGTASGIPTTENGQDITHAARYGTLPIPPKPTWMTIPGGTQGRTANPATNCDDPLPVGQTKLGDFANQMELGCVVNLNWHNVVHTRIGGGTNCVIPATEATCGSMSADRFSPKDPIFWRWHTFMDTVRADALSISIASPHVLYESPLRIFHYITELPTVNVTVEGKVMEEPAIAILFDESVTGVKASDVTVNGSPAIHVSGEGRGPYVFSGFAYPERGLVEVKALKDTIINDENEPFEGDHWTFTLVDPVTDDDNDGLINDQEVNVWLTNPTHPDSDHDGLSDGYEASHGSCLNPLVHDAQLDSDEDGIDNYTEYLLGLDPCPQKIDPPTGDADGDGVVNFMDNSPLVANPSQADLDGDGIGDASDSDIDGDGIKNVVDNCPTFPNPSQADSNGDGTGDACDPSFTLVQKITATLRDGGTMPATLAVYGKYYSNAEGKISLIRDAPSLQGIVLLGNGLEVELNTIKLKVVGDKMILRGAGSDGSNTVAISATLKFSFDDFSYGQDKFESSKSTVTALNVNGDKYMAGRQDSTGVLRLTGS